MVSMMCALLGLTLTASGAPEDRWEIASGETRVALHVKDGQVLIERLESLPVPVPSAGCAGEAFNWMAGEFPLPLLQRVRANGTEAQTKWCFTGAQRDADVLALTFENAEPKLTLKSLWRARLGRGPVEHWIEIRNDSAAPVTLPQQESLSLSILPRNEKTSVWSIKRGGSNASTEGGVSTEPLHDGLVLDLVSNCDDGASPVPWIAVQSGKRHGLYLGWEFSGLGRIHAAARGKVLSLDAGLLPDFATDIAPGETFWVPPAFVGCYQGDIDEGAYALHRWIIEKLRPAVRADVPDPTLAYNLYLDAGGNQAKEADVLRSAQFCHDIGFETFMPDAMWFPETGDWRWDPSRFPNGVAPIEKFVHDSGMRLALWCAWTNGGISEDPGALSVRGTAGHPDWFNADFAPDWTPAAFSGAQLCLACPEAREWEIRKTQWLMQHHNLDYLKHDCGPIINFCNKTTHRHTHGTDASYWATMGYYEVQEKLRGAVPGVILENCSGGGHIKDFGVIQRTHYTVTTDTLSNLPDRQSIYDSTYALPPILLQAYTYERNYNVPGDDPEPYLWRSAMMGAWQIDPTNTLTWTEQQKDLARQSAQIYKDWVRPMLKDVKVHHVLPRPDGKNWDGLFYWSPSLKRGTLYIFRSAAPEDEKTVKLKGLHRATHYNVWSQDGSVKRIRITGGSLMSRGLQIRLDKQFTSDLICVQEAD